MQAPGSREVLQFLGEAQGQLCQSSEGQRKERTDPEFAVLMASAATRRGGESLPRGSHQQQGCRGPQRGASCWGPLRTPLRGAFRSHTTLAAQCGKPPWQVRFGPGCMTVSATGPVACDARTEGRDGLIRNPPPLWEASPRDGRRTFIAFRQQHDTEDPAFRSGVPCTSSMLPAQHAKDNVAKHPAVWEVVIPRAPLQAPNGRGLAEGNPASV
jgi:hypothetical protein